MIEAATAALFPLGRSLQSASVATVSAEQTADFPNLAQIRIAGLTPERPDQDERGAYGVKSQADKQTQPLRAGRNEDHQDQQESQKHPRFRNPVFMAAPPTLKAKYAPVAV
jgi:hypothetical protein